MSDHDMTKDRRSPRQSDLAALAIIVLFAFVVLSTE
jgi:hypothetical protein